MEGESSPEKQSFWLFFMNDRIFPFGWAEQKGINQNTIFITSYLCNSPFVIYRTSMESNEFRYYE